MKKCEITKGMLQYMKDNYHTNEEIKNYCDDLVKREREKLILNPKVYMVRTPDKNGNYYINARIFIPITIHKTKELRVYVGKVKDFVNGHNDKLAKKIGEDNMRLRLKKMKEENKF